MPYIQCKEQGCTEIISSPNMPVNVLFGVSELMQTIKEASLNTESQKKVGDLLEKVKVEVQNDNMFQQEMEINITDKLTNTSDTDKNSKKSKVIILECILNHRHSYLVNYE